MNDILYYSMFKIQGGVSWQQGRILAEKANKKQYEKEAGKTAKVF